MIIKNEKKVFDLYTEVNDNFHDGKFHEALKTPFIQEKDGRVWAANEYIMLMVNPECVSGEYKHYEIGNNLPLREYNADIPFKVSDLQDAIDKCPQEPEVETTCKEKTCPECKGFGKVTTTYIANHDNYPYSVDVDCPICDGEGKLEEEIETPTGRMIPNNDCGIKLGKAFFQPYLIGMVIKTCDMLGYENIRLVRDIENGMNIIELSRDIHIAIMPIFNSWDAIEIVQVNQSFNE